MFAPCGQIENLDDGDILWRRVKDDLDSLTWDADFGCWRPRPTPPSNSFQFDPDMSMSWREHLDIRHHLGPEAALDTEGRYTLVYALSARDVRQTTCFARHSPVGDTPPACAHSSIDWPQGIDKATKKEIRYGLSQAMALVYGTPTQEPPPGA